MTEVSKILNETHSINVFSDGNAFDHAQRVATMLAKSDLVPMAFKNNVANCVIAMEMAMRIKASPMMVMQNMYIVYGKPAWSSQFLIACINACGKFSPLRYEEKFKDDSDTVPFACRAYAVDKATDEKIYGTWITIEMAQSEGWIDKKGSKWKTMPDLMLRYRAASFFQRQFCPEISMGFHTVEEQKDIGPTKTKEENTLVVVGNKQIQNLIENANDAKELEAIKRDHLKVITKDIALLSIFNKKQKSLSNDSPI